MGAAESFSFKNIFESIHDPVSVHDTDLRIIRANEAMCALLGQKQDEIIGKHCYSVFHGTDRPWRNCPHVRCVRTGNAAIATIEDPNLPCKFVVSCSPIYDDSGNIRGTVHILRKPHTGHTGRIRRNNTTSALEALAKLEGFLLICASCRKIKDEQGRWDYLTNISPPAPRPFSVMACPDCYGKFKKELECSKAPGR